MRGTKKQVSLSVKEFADAIGVAAITVRRWDRERTAGKPHATRRTKDGHRAYSWSQVEAYLKKAKQEYLDKEKLRIERCRRLIQKK